MTRHSLVLASAALLGLAACSSDNATSPKPETIPQLVSHYDSVSQALANGGEDSAAFATDLQLFNGIIADGIRPTPITLTIGSQQQTWFGNFANWIFNNGQDSVQLVLLWKDTNVDAFVGLFLGNAQPVAEQDGVAALTGDFLTDSLVNYTATFTTTSGSCALTPPADTAVFFIFPTFAGSSLVTGCTPAQATLNGSVISASGDTTASAALQSVAFTNQTITGVRLVTSIMPTLHILPPPQSGAAGAFTQRGIVFMRRR